MSKSSSVPAQTASTANGEAEEITFGQLLKKLRKEARLIQGQLASELDCSIALISRLESGERLPQLDFVQYGLVPALGLDEKPEIAQKLIELAIAARHEQSPVAIPRMGEVYHPVRDELRRHPLPTWPIKLVGREADGQRVRQQLTAQPGRLLTLTGPAGVGKTRLAASVAEADKTLYPDGVFYIPLAALTDPAVVLPTLAAEFGVLPGPKSLRQELLDHLHPKKLLLVLDGFDHVAVAAPLLTEILDACPAVQLLVAGPDALDIPAEQVYDVAPLDLTATVELFQAWVEYIRPTLDITANDEAAIEAICQRLAGLPLAVELVASRVDRYEPSTMLEQLTQFGLDLAHGQPSLQKVLEWSYEQLTAEEKAVLQRLSVFASTFDYKAVLSLGLGFEQRGLVRKGLVQQQPPVEGEGRFLLPTVVREFGLAKLAATGESNLKHRDHAQYYYDRARRHVPAPHLPRSASQERVWRQSLKPELNNLRSAMRWCFSEGGEAVLGVQIGNALGRYWAISGRWTEGRKWLTEALTQPSIPAAEQAEAHRHLARLDKLEGDNDSARQHLTDSLALYQQATERWSEAVSQYELSEVALDQGEYDQARQLATDSLTTFTEMDDRHYMALALIQLAQVALDRDRDSSRAADLFEEALQRLAELPPSDIQAETWNRLGLVELELDRGEYAQLHFRQALEHFLYVADDAGMGRAFYGLGLAELIDQRPNRAAAQFNSALKRCLQGEDKVGVVLAVEGLAGAAAPQQDYQRMARLLGASHTHRQSLAMGSKPNKLAVSEADLAAAQADLRDRWLAEQANGEQMSFEQMVREALSQA